MVQEAPFTSPGSVDVQPGLDWLAEILRQSLSKYQTDETLDFERYATDEANALQKYIAELQDKQATANRQLQKDLAAIEQNAANQRQAADAALQRELQAGNIDAQKYLQQRELAQREAEFTRTFALQERQQKHDEEMDHISAELSWAQEARQERTLQAQLAADPNNFVMYEFYKRALGDPQPMGSGMGADTASTMQGFFGQSGGQTQGATGAGGAASGPRPPSQDRAVQQARETYPGAPPAYDDQTIQQVMQGIIQGTDTQYNPNMGGTGAFGVDVPSPNEMSRSQFQSMDPSSLAILASFIEAGVEMGPNGERVSMSPEDWFQQMGRSFIPTMNPEANATTRYN